mmetsp:Transcript_35549/g.86567  ORF Transcript_35549/g.86567 Transcript_35549/m.86567 type:complete len:263 (+) Transcript_35549:2408-3196(+)
MRAHDSPVLSTIITSCFPPTSQRYLKTPRCPDPAHSSKHVVPLWSRAYTSAPAATRALTYSSLPIMHATCSAVTLPGRATESTQPPAASSSFRFTTSPLAAAATIGGSPRSFLSSKDSIKISRRLHSSRAASRCSGPTILPVTMPMLPGPHVTTDGRRTHALVSAARSSTMRSSRAIICDSTLRLTLLRRSLSESSQSTHLWNLSIAIPSSCISSLVAPAYCQSSLYHSSSFSLCFATHVSTSEMVVFKIWSRIFSSTLRGR